MPLIVINQDQPESTSIVNVTNENLSSITDNTESNIVENELVTSLILNGVDTTVDSGVPGNLTTAESECKMFR